MEHSDRQCQARGKYLSLHLQPKDNCPEGFMFPKNLYAKMFAVKFVLNPDSNPDDSDSVAPTLDKPNQPLFIETGLIGEQFLVRLEQGGQLASHSIFEG